MAGRLVLVEVIGWTAYAFGPILCGVLVWDTSTGRAHNSYLFFGGWMFAEFLAFIYVWNTGKQLPILANTVSSFVLIALAAIIHYRTRAKVLAIGHR